MTQFKQLTPPAFFEESKRNAGKITIVPYGQRAAEAEKFARDNQIQTAGADIKAKRPRIALFGIDEQLTFCGPEFKGELFVSGTTGDGAMQDAVRAAEFLYRHLHIITQTIWTMDTHRAWQIFYPLFWVDQSGQNHPAPFTQITYKDVCDGKWRPDPKLTFILGKEMGWLQKYALHYTKRLEDGGRYALVIWPYHGMIGGIGHALIPILEEASFFHSVAKTNERDFQIKGGHPRSENYSVFQQEVMEDQEGKAFSQRNTQLIEMLTVFDMVIFFGEAGDYCVPWSIADFLNGLPREMAEKLYIMRDCISPVVAGPYDGTANMEAALKRFEDAGMHVVKSTDPIETWPDIDKRGLKV